MSKEKTNLGRRNALRLIATTAAAVPVIGCSEKVAQKVVVKEEVPAAKPAVRNLSAPKQTLARGTPTDPDLLNPVVSWEMQLDASELAVLVALCDVIIPADEISPGASSVGAQHYINEYVSAPYTNNKADLVTIRGGIVWLEGESRRRFDTSFTELNEPQKAAICDDISWTRTAKPQFQAGARFFAKVRVLTTTAFYTTEEGMADIGYVGNRPMASFPGAPPEVLKRLGLDS
ncbi:gluconate 2-dehydrogenase subunit 3 family protein [Microbulbifer sp. OS29]|uniref:Gluconate 2-dehydrogenase subunit 3 family protein n=1 Tax=Microbulbifer okhotskensis TaxID=2926617 RepID=A0A9X2ENN6_9GAMM|nr:gluconate 2-dehydrogenase subunit 3 family protein [Microbulbifer okhotskensis]MCO1334989.1 gluconate 2-dehydrogenase subunit 3 family protein [Microbulbifer okhotskensis]